MYLAIIMTLSDYSIKQETILDTIFLFGIIISYLKLLSKSQYAYNTIRLLTFVTIQEHLDFTGDNI